MERSKGNQTEGNQTDKVSHSLGHVLTNLSIRRHSCPVTRACAAEDD